MQETLDTAELSGNDLGRLMRIRRRSIIALIVVPAAIVAAFIPGILNGSTVLSGWGAFAGIIGLVVTLPRRTLLKDLGITPAQSRAAIDAERERRQPIPVISDEQLLQRERGRFAIRLAVGLVSLGILAVSAGYFFAKSGVAVDEHAPLDPWFGISFVSGFIALVLVFVAGFHPKLHWSASNIVRRCLAVAATST